MKRIKNTGINNITSRIRHFIVSLILLMLHSTILLAATEGKIITLNLGAPTNPKSFSVATKGQWTETYSNNYPFIGFDLFKLTHIIGGSGGTDVGGGMSYWDGFTYCTSGDKTDYGATGTSAGWVANQWGNMAGGGIKTDSNGNIQKDSNGKVIAEPGIPYLVAYWGYYMEMYSDGDPCLQVLFNDEKSYEAIGMYVNNHPWPFYGNIHGDGFARPFEEGDYFKLYIHGFNEKMEDIGITVEHTLAEYKNGQLIQSDKWEWVDLSPLGRVSGLYFTMETTDSDPIYGPNTAVYFCMDKLQVRAVETNIKPERPSSLKGEPTETTINFSWENTNNDPTVKGFNIYLNDELKVQTTDTKYVFSGLIPYTSYKLGVEAFGQNNTISDRASVTVSTTDETTPTMPSQLSGIASANSINLSWEPSTDNVGVVEYNIYLNGVRKKKLAETHYTLTGLTSGTIFTVEVEALDAAGNKSEKASVIVATTDETVPTTPSNLSAQPTETSVALNWTASTDNVGVVGYRVYVNDELYKTVSTARVTISELKASTNYTFSVAAFDASGNISDKASIPVSTTDETSPSVPTNLISQVLGTSVALNWTASTDNIGVVGYRVYLNGELLKSLTETSLTITGINPEIQYTIAVVAYDAAGNQSGKTDVIVAVNDQMAPTIPSNIKAQPTERSILISWTASTDNMGVAGYNIYVNGVLKGFTNSTSYTISGLSASALYTLGIEAYDARGNKSDKTTAMVSTTDETAPTQPENLNAVPSLTTVDLSWSASVDNVGVEKYQIYLNEGLYSATETTSITVTGLTANTNYLFSVEAIDKAGNKSAKSTIQTATINITGISQVNKVDIKAYPNPFTNYIIVNLPSSERVSIYNSAGQCKFKIELESGNNRIDVSTLPSGIYLVQIGEKTIKMTK